MTPSDIIWWEQMRAKGAWWFIAREGIGRHGLRVGLSVTGIAAFFLFLFSGVSTVSFKILAVLFPLMTLLPGLSIGLALWKQHERDYRKYVASGPTPVGTEP